MARTAAKAAPPWIACTVWVRYTDAAGKSTVRSHECWNVDLFMRNRAVEAAQANEQFARENKRKRGKAKAERLTEAQYDRERA